MNSIKESSSNTKNSTNSSMGRPKKRKATKNRSLRNLLMEKTLN